MINVDKVTKKFDNFIALDEMTLNVKSGSAYGLLAQTVRENPHCCASLQEYTSRIKAV